MKQSDQFTPYPGDAANVFMPAQRLTDGQKKKIFGSVKKWYEAMVNYIYRNSFRNNYVNRTELADNVLFSQGKWNPRHYDYLLDPYVESKAGNDITFQRPKFPVTVENFDIISNKLDLLVGEELKRPFKWSVSDFSADGFNHMLEEKKNMMIDLFKVKFMEQLDEESQEFAHQIGLGPQTPVPKDVKSPEDVDKYFQKTYKSQREVTCSRLLNWLIKEQDLEHKFAKIHKDFFVTGCELYKVYDNGGKPDIRRVNILNFDCDLSEESLYVHDASWCIEKETVTIADIIDRYHAELTDEDYQTILKMAGKDMWRDSYMGYSAVDDPINFRTDLYMNNAMVEIYHCEWKGLREVQFAIYETDDGDEYEELYDPEEEAKERKRQVQQDKETQSLSKRKEQQSLEVSNTDPKVKEAVMNPGQDVYSPDLSVKREEPEEEQMVSDEMGTPTPDPDQMSLIGRAEIGETPEQEQHEHTKEEKKKPKKIEKRWINQVYKASRIGNYDNFILLDYSPVEQDYDITNPSKCILSYGGVISPYPLMSKVKSLQKLYNVIMYRLHLQFAKSKGRIGVLDIALMPKTEGFDLSKWMYFMDSMGIAFINSKENVEAGTGNNFQTQLDLSFAQDLTTYFTMLDKIEQAVARLSGIAPQREGQTYASETLGGNNQAMMQSAAITEYMVFIHNQVKKNALQAIVDKARCMFKNGIQTQYILDDGDRMLLNIEDDFANGEYGIFVVNSPAELEIHQIVKQYAMQLVQAGNIALSSIIKVLKSPSLTDSIRILEEEREKMSQEQQQQLQQQQQAQMQTEQMKQQVMMQIESLKKELKQMEFDYQDKWNMRDNETRVKVAEITVAGRNDVESMKAANQMTDANQNLTPDYLEQQQTMHDMQLAERDQNLKEIKTQHDMQMDEHQLQRDAQQQQMQQMQQQVQPTQPTPTE